MRFEVLLPAGMGSNYLTNRPWSEEEWYKTTTVRRLGFLTDFGPLGSYSPSKTDS